MPQRLLNKVAVVTAADSSLGRAVAERFAAEGAKVVVAGRRRELLDEVAQRAPARMLSVAADVTRPSDLEQLVGAAVRRFGRVDVLVPSAGDGRRIAFAESTPEAVQEQFEIHFLGAQQTVRHFLPHLNRGASVVFVTGEPDASREGLSIYTATQGALRTLARFLSAELAPRAIRVNCLAVSSPQLAPSDDQGPAGLDEAAEAAVFLASEASRGLTGQELVIGAGERPG